MSSEELIIALGIFVLRVLNYAIGTLRLVSITRDQKLLAALMATFEALIFAVVIANIVNDLENFINLFAYCIGAAVGSWAGMMLESRLIKGFAIINIFTSSLGHEIALAMRESGFGVTEMGGEGRDGAVMTLRSVVNKREVARLTRLIHKINAEAFIAVEEARTVQRGWLGAGRGKTM